MQCDLKNILIEHTFVIVNQQRVRRQYNKISVNRIPNYLLISMYLSNFKERSTICSSVLAEQ